MTLDIITKIFSSVTIVILNPSNWQLSNMPNSSITINIHLLISAFLISNVFASYGQQMNLTIVDENNQPIPYVNLYFEKSSYGTLSDVNGLAQIDVSLLDKSDTLNLTCIGYENKALELSELQNNSVERIRLTTKSYALQNVEIIAEQARFKSKNVGFNTALELCQTGFSNKKKTRGRERAVLIKNNSEAYIESINFNSTSVSHDSVVYEVNIYEYDHGIGPIINNHRIFVTLKPSDNSKTYSLDLSKMRLFTRSDFLISFEAVEVFGSGGVMFKCPCHKKTSIYEKSTDGNWTISRERPPAIWCKLKIPKN